MPTTASFTRPTYLYPLQHDAVFCPHRWALIESGQNTGTRTACIAWLLERAFGGKRGEAFWWVAPTSAQLYDIFQRIKLGLPTGAFIASESPQLKITLPQGAIIAFKSAEKPPSLDSEGVFAAVVQNPASCKEDSWFTLRATLTPTEAPARIAGRVRGKDNWFYHFCRRAEEGTDPNLHYSKLTIFDAIEAGIISQSEVDDARRNLPEMVFRELYLAEPCDGKIDSDSWRGDPRNLPDEELALIAGIDPQKLPSLSQETLRLLNVETAITQ